jgi:hypothetical protein
MAAMLVLVLCMSTVIPAMAKGTAGIVEPDGDEYDKWDFYITAAQGPYNVGDTILVNINVVYGNIGLEMFNYESSWSFDKNYLSFVGIRNSIAYFTVIRAPENQPVDLPITAVYSVGSLNLQRSATVRIAAQQSSWRFTLSTSSGPYDVGETIQIYLRVVSGNMDANYFNDYRVWVYDASYLRFDGFYNQTAYFTVLRADATARTLNIQTSYSVGSVNTSDSVNVVVQSTGVRVTEVRLSSRSITMDANSQERISAAVYPNQATNYTVEWTSSNPNVATVSGNGINAVITSKSVDGTVTVTATVIDNSTRTKYTDSCQVRVEKEKAAYYNVTAISTVGTAYTGTQLYEELRNQFRNSFGSFPNDNSTSITFSRVNNTGELLLRLGDGRSVTSNAAYSMTQLKSMYLEAGTTGTFSLPYSMTYNNMTLSGSVNLTVSPATVTVSASLSENAAYTFGQNAVGGSVATILNSAVQNALRGTNYSWNIIRFTVSSSFVGTLYQDSGLRQISNTTNISAANLANVYFVPDKTGGVFTTNFSTYDASGNALVVGTLNITVPAAPKIDPSKLPAVNPTPADKVGKVAGDYYYTDIVTTVNGTRIDAINIGGMTLINVEDLRTHGFSVVWDGSARTLRAERSSTAPRTGSAVSNTSGTVGAKLGSYYFTDIVTYLDGYPINAYNTDGRTYICAEDMRYYGYSVIWNEGARTLTVTSN